MELDTPISAFKSARDTVPVTTTLRAFLFSEKFAPLVAEVRAIDDKKQRDEKKKLLPAATISGVFSKRCIEGITQYNGLLCLDFDGKENPDLSPFEMKLILKDIDEVAYAGLSVSGTGVFAIIQTDNTDVRRHSELVETVGNMLIATGLQYDRSCKDVSRLRFVSKDEKAYVATNPTVLPTAELFAQLDKSKDDRPPRPIRIKAPQYSGTDTTRKKVESYVSTIEERRIDLTHEYQDWVNLAFALANEFGTEGEDYFHRISANNPKYSFSDAEKKYKNALKTGSGRLKIGTFFQLANNAGVRI